MASAWDDIDVTNMVIVPWNAGRSALDIAATLPGNFSRNSVIAKIWRMRSKGVQLREDPSGHGHGNGRLKPKTAGKNGALKPMQLRSAKKRTANRAERALAVVPFTAQPDPTEPTVMSVADLEQHHCRWIYSASGEPGFGFCGRERVVGLPYCLPHAKRSYYGLDAKRPEAEAQETHQDKALAPS